MDEIIKEIEEISTGIVEDYLELLKPFVQQIDRLSARIKELEERQKWIDEVARPTHPDDERPWCAAYLDCRARINELVEGIESVRSEKDWDAKEYALIELYKLIEKEKP